MVGSRNEAVSLIIKFSLSLKSKVIEAPCLCHMINHMTVMRSLHDCHMTVSHDCHMTVSHGLTSVVTDLICNPPTVVIPSWGRGEGGTFFSRKMAATGILRVTITFGAVERKGDDPWIIH